MCALVAFYGIPVSPVEPFQVSSFFNLLSSRARVCVFYQATGRLRKSEGIPGVHGLHPKCRGSLPSTEIAETKAADIGRAGGICEMPTRGRSAAVQGSA